ncbi:phospholipase, patatin family [gamma proteobacterium NOR5-3]|nr:phospholipase, patatin family [gamma proteobacterium NOR5-3]
MSAKGPIFILSIDGGGARGAIPATLLHHLENHHDITIRDDFDFFAGVSTGGLVAAYIAKNAGSLEALANESYSARVLSDIFDKSIWDKMLDRMQNQPKYDGKGKRAYIDSIMGDMHINEIVDKHLLILAYDFMNRELVTFKNNRGHDATYNPSLAEVCDAASAAPTLYPPVATAAPKRRWLVDGALATNDPSHCAISEALAMGYKLGEVWMVSIATGSPVHDLSQEDRDRIGAASQEWGIFGWLRNGLFDHMMTASSTVSAHHCQELLGERYLRIRGELPRKLMQLDNTSEARIEDLKSYAFAWYEEHLEDFQELLKGVREARDAHARSQSTAGSSAQA